MWSRRETTTWVAIGLAAGVIGCGGSSSSEVIARVGDEQISKASITHWMRVLHGEGARFSAGGSNGALAKQVLSLLISSRWLVGAAAEHGISISPSDIRAQIARLEQIGFEGGSSELRAFLESTGETVADLETQARNELVAVRLRHLVLARALPVTMADVTQYYTQHKRTFLVPERREARFINRKSKAAAEKIKREVEAGQSLTPPWRVRVGEVFAGARVPPYPGNEYEAAIDASKPYVVAGPYHIGNDYWLYKVVKIIPAHLRELSDVAGSIRHKLTSIRRRQALMSAVHAWATLWKARTDCEPGYVVSSCRQYAGPPTLEDPFGIL